MSLSGEYARLTPTELKRAINDPEWGAEFVHALYVADGRGAAERYRLGIYKSWSVLGFLLERVGFPVDIARGEVRIPDAPDWGIGAPRYLAPDRVRIAAAAMAATSAERLTADVTPAELATAELYPSVREDNAEEWLAIVADDYRALVPFFRAAARDGEAVAVWLS